MITWPVPHGFAKLVLKFPDRDFFTTTIFANCFERTALVPGRNTTDPKKRDIILLLLDYSSISQDLVQTKHSLVVEVSKGNSNIFHKIYV